MTPEAVAVNRRRPRTSFRLSDHRLSDVLLPVAVGLWALGVSRINPGAVGGLGLIPALPITWFAGVAVLVVSAGTLLTAARESRGRLLAHVVALVAMLHGTAPLIYAEPRYSWLYKHIGVVQYLSAHGRLDHNIDIFQNWPGFFALASWFDHVAGISSPLQVAAWSQLVINLLACVALAFAARMLSLTWRERWFAILLFVGSNWIAQDYFSPQALGFVLSLGIFAMALHWVRTERGPQWQANVASRLRAPQDDTEPTTPMRRRTQFLTPLAPVIAVTLVYSALVIVHELSPYVVAIQLGALMVAGWVRPRWLPALLLTIAVAYLAPRFHYVDQNYGLLKSLGSFFSNARPPSTRGLRLSSDQRLVADASRILSAFVWLLALVGMWRRFRSRRDVVVLGVLTFSPFLLLLLQNYGGEALLRVALFSLPWAACLAASAVFGPPAERRRLPRTLLVGGALAVTVALFVPAYFGSDGVTVMSPSEVRASQYLYAKGQPGPIVYLDTNFPVSIGARYNRFLPTRALLGASGQPPVVLSAAEAKDITDIALAAAVGHATAYFVISESMLTYARAYGLTTSTSTAPLRDSLARSPNWRVFYRTTDTTIYQLR
jgi:hypothetical protein